MIGWVKSSLLLVAVLAIPYNLGPLSPAVVDRTPGDGSGLPPRASGRADAAVITTLLRFLRMADAVKTCPAYEIPSAQIAAYWWAKYTLPTLLNERMREQGGGR